MIITNHQISRNKQISIPNYKNYKNIFFGLFIVSWLLKTVWNTCLLFLGYLA